MFFPRCTVWVQRFFVALEQLVELHQAAAEFQVDELSAATEAALAAQVDAKNLVLALAVASCHIEGKSCSQTKKFGELWNDGCVLMRACVAFIRRNNVHLLAGGDMATMLASKPALCSALQRQLDCQLPSGMLMPFSYAAKMQ